MDSIAIISDIHGNMTALETVLEHIHQRGITRIFCLGDLVGKGPHSSAAVDRIREVCEVVVLGNWDDFIQNPQDNEVTQWHQDQLGLERLAYLGTLPFHVDFYMSGKYIRLFHASAKSVHHRVFPLKSSLEEKEAMFDNTEWIKPLEENRKPDVVGFGDIHVALIDWLDEYRTLFNVGSLGNPLDMPLSTFAILHGEYGSKTPGPFSIEIVRLPYDIEKEISVATEAGMPNLETYSSELRTAIYGRRSKLQTTASK